MIFYYAIKTTMLSAYLYTWYWSIKLFLLPLINMYGGWTFLGYFFGIFIAAFAFSFVFFAIPKPHPSQATYKETLS